jgi:4-amino-4-deoxy-L-arabinose transferase-like glycosyltransferase
MSGLLSHAADRQQTSATACWRPVLGVVAGLAALRLATLLLALQDGDIGLHVDEAQYWHWAQTLEWGYYSKPPLIAALIAALTVIGGDGLIAVKSAGWLLYPLTALTLAWLAQSLAGANQRDASAHPGPSDRHGMPAPTLAALLAATIFLTSPLAALLGLAATTDAPLLLFWSLASALLWRAGQARTHREALIVWALLGLVCGLGLLSKYSFAAWLPGAAWWWYGWWRTPLPRSAVPSRGGAGPWLAAGLMLSMLLPHLLWNAGHGWPTLQHTVEITTAAATAGNAASRGVPSWAGPLARVGTVLGGFWVMLGPLWLLWLPVWLRPSAARHTAVERQTRRFILALHLPLLLLGLAQAIGSVPQINWTAPLQVAGVLWLALHLSARAHTARHWQRTALHATLALHLLAGAAVPLAQRLWTAPTWVATGIPTGQPAPSLPRHLDIWARMRGWPQAYAQLHDAASVHLQRWPGSPVIASSRTLIAQGAYEWRDLGAHWMTWAPPGPVHNHYQLTARWPATTEPPLDGAPCDESARPLLIVADAPLPADLLVQLEAPRLLAEAHAAAAGHSVVRLQLWSARSRCNGPSPHSTHLGPART